MIAIKRIYDAPSPSDGCRVLVDRLWPRGVSKESARIDSWLKEIAPSEGLRKWFSHEPGKWAGFRSRYAEELAGKKELLSQLRGLGKKFGTLTFVFAAKDEARNNAVVLREVLRKK